MATAKKNGERGRFRVGDRVMVPFGIDRVEGTIEEDRGAVGANGRWIYRVRVPMLYSEDMVFEMPADELQRVELDR